MGKPTLADVARAARVSPTTAARVVHENGYVSAENRSAVLTAIATLGYRPNLQARGLRTSRSQTLGLIYSDEANPVFTRLSHAIRRKASEAGYTVLSVDHDNDGRGEAGGIWQLVDHRADAVISCHARDVSAYGPLRKAGIPIIEVEREILSDSHLVVYDERPGLRDALRALADFGHRRVGFIGGTDIFAGRAKPSVDIEEARVGIFRDCAREVGLSAQDCPVLLGDYFRRDAEGRLPGEILARQMMADHAPTAIVAGSDVLAAGILQGLYGLGLRVPQDVSVVGYDDTIADLLTPQLSSIRQPYNKIAAAVMEIVAQAGGPLQRRSVATRLIHRASVGPRKDHE